jgi:hypothetical protein
MAVRLAFERLRSTEIAGADPLQATVLGNNPPARAS